MLKMIREYGRSGGTGPKENRDGSEGELQTEETSLQRGLLFIHLSARRSAQFALRLSASDGHPDLCCHDRPNTDIALHTGGHPRIPSSWTADDRVRARLWQG